MVEGPLSVHTYLDKGNYSRSPIERIFGSWQNMKKELGLELSRDILYDKHDEIIKKYRNKKSTLEIAKEYSVDDEVIRQILIKNNIKRRGANETRRNPLDESVFEKPLSNKASWLFGLVVADGSITNNKNGYYLNLEFSKKDIELINYAIRILDYNGSIYNRDKTNSCSITVGSKKMFYDLKDLGLVQNKTYIENELNLKNISDSDFVRGFFDGDGSVISYKNTNTVQFSGHKTYMVHVSNLIENNLDINTSVFERSTKKENRDTWVCSFCGNIITKKFYDFIYEDTKYYLRRKKKKFENNF